MITRNDMVYVIGVAGYLIHRDSGNILGLTSALVAIVIAYWRAKS